jgi:magnesium chelatase family protein
VIAKAHSATLSGIEALPIVVEVDLQGVNDQGMFILVGLPDQAVAESRERVRSSIRNSQMDYPNSRKIVCNLAPGDIRKEGPFLDLPIACALLAVNNQIPLQVFEDTMIIGELGLDGNLRPINGAVSIALMALEKGFKRLILPKANAAEASVAIGVEVYGVTSLLEAVELLNGSMLVQPERFDDSPESRLPEYMVYFSDVKG